MNEFSIDRYREQAIDKDKFDMMVDDMSLCDDVDNMIKAGLIFVSDGDVCGEDVLLAMHHVKMIKKW